MDWKVLKQDLERFRVFSPSVIAWLHGIMLIGTPCQVDGPSAGLNVCIPRELSQGPKKEEQAECQTKRKRMKRRYERMQRGFEHTLFRVKTVHHASTILFMIRTSINLHLYHHKQLHVRYAVTHWLLSLRPPKPFPVPERVRNFLNPLANVRPFSPLDVDSVCSVDQDKFIVETYVAPLCPKRVVTNELSDDEIRLLATWCEQQMMKTGDFACRLRAVHFWAPLTHQELQPGRLLSWGSSRYARYRQYRTVINAVHHKDIEAQLYYLTRSLDTFLLKYLRR